MKSLLVAMLAVAALAPAQPQKQPPLVAEFDHTHARWTAVLERHVVGDRFDYAGLAEDRGPLDAYITDLRVVSRAQLESWTREQRYAFWINTYNAHVVQLVMDNYPLDSIKDLGGLFSPVWKKRFIRMQRLHPDGKDRELSLNDVEHEILRPRFRDARVHAAINCASIGCPPLRAEAFVAERLEEQLDDQVRKWLADPTRNRYDREARTLRVSELFDWFEEDFERDAGSVRKWIARYAPADEAAWLRTERKVRVRHLDYDWSLNAAPSRD